MMTVNATAAPETPTAIEDETQAATAAVVPARATANHEMQTAMASPRKRSRQLLPPRHPNP
jgi:hypothetical protein